MFDDIIAYCQDNLPLTLVAAALLALLAYRKFKVFISIVLVALLLAGIFYAISEMGATASSHKARMATTPEIPH